MPSPRTASAPLRWPRWRYGWRSAALRGALGSRPARAGAGEPLDDAGYLAFADRVAAGLEIALGRGGRRRTSAATRAPRPGRTRTCCSCTPRAALARRTGAARHDDRARADRRAHDARRRCSPSRGAAAAQPQPLLAQAPRRRPARPRLARLADRRGARVGVARPAERSRCRPGSPTAARDARRALRAPPPVALPARAQEPDQLERAARRLGRADDRRRPAAARGLPAPPRALPARRAPAAARHADDQPRRGLRLPLQPGARRGAAD